MIVGDTHGNNRWMRDYIFPVAMTIRADAIIVVGDYGAWEHTAAGIAFMDEVGALATESSVPLYWLHGNHDKWSHTVRTYDSDDRGFFVCRPNLFYIPQGHSWTWDGVTIRSFGGAYSIDKAWRVQREQEKYLAMLRKESYRRQATGRSVMVSQQAETLWFPEEEMTDAQMTDLLTADSSRKDIILSHDKPYSAKPDWNRKDLPGCLGNQLRLERALRAHWPSWWFHGHLHYHYVDKINGGDWGTTVVGLEPDDAAAQHTKWRRANAWAMVDLKAGSVRSRVGSEVFLDSVELQAKMDMLN